MDGQSKVQLILELKSRLKTGLTRAKSAVNSNVNSMKQKFSDFKISAVKNLRSIASEVPIVGRALQLLKNPLVLGTALVIGLGVAIGGLTAKASEFEHAFLPIKQLNLDKSAKEMQAYQASIKVAAFDTGASLLEATDSVYDIQSATGLFGKDAIDVFTKVSKFSLVTGASIVDTTNSVTKSMKAFGLEVKDIDSLLESNAKTVQLGITTFDQLAKVQTEYAGAAAGAGQSVDTANKLFAAFTSIAKDSAQAATLTKTAFQGLTQQATVDALGKMLNIDMYDKATKEMRSMDSILKEVADKFKGMDSKSIDSVINKIGGPEGLRAMFVKLKTDSAGFIKGMDDFDKTEFNFAKAMENAMIDAKTLATMAKNRKDIIAVEIGQKFLPIWVTILEKVNNILTFVWKNFDTIGSIIKNIGIGLVALKAGMIIFNIVTMANPIGLIVLAAVSLIALITVAVKKFDDFGAAILLALGPLGVVLTIAINIKKQFQSIKDAFTDGGFLAGIKRLGLVIIDALVLPIQQLLTLIGKIPGLEGANRLALNVEDFRKNVLGIDTTVRLNKKQQEADEDEAVGSGANNPFGTTNSEQITGGTTTSGADSINKITGSAKQVKNIVINIDSFIKGGINTNKTEIQQMDPAELEEFLNNMMLRVINNVELSY